MTTSDAWYENNERYLAAALAWLRLRLERHAGPRTHDVPAAALVSSPAAPPRRTYRFWRRGSAPALPPPDPAPLLLTGTVTDENLTRAEAAAEEAAGCEPPPALVSLGHLLGLSAFERNTLLLCCAMELDPQAAALCARAQGDSARPYPTFALALALFSDPAWDVLSPERPLRFWRLIEITQPGAGALTASPLRADERIVNAVKGLGYLDDRLAPFLTPVDLPDALPALPPSQQSVVDAILARWQQAAPPVVQLLGADAPSKTLIAAQAAAATGRRLYRLPAELLPAQGGELETLARLWQRESLLLPVALYLDAQEGGSAPSLNRFLDAGAGPLFLGTRELWPRGGRDDLALDVARPTPAEQQAAWEAALGDKAGGIPARLAGQFTLDLAAIHRIAGMGMAADDADEEARAASLWDACRDSARPRLDTLAQRLEPKSGWDDLILPDGPMGLLRQVVAQVGQRRMVYGDWGFAARSDRGLGINALFAGDSGTGKTLAAEVIAHELRLNLYRIDLSAVVSKYIGETEENLRKLFDAAEDGGAVLFFDEADALFGKRSEVKDSHDRYANIEVNYLLQRMEAYRGLAILATNMKNALDSAFLRRLRFIVHFPFPGLAERRRMWERAFPASAPTAGLDFDRLARLNLAGGSIVNVALNAAFLAAQAGGPITMPLALAAARTEFIKLERPLNEADFRWREPAGAAA